jgi:hypothetical protein
MKAVSNDLPYAESEAAMLLAGAIEARAREGVSLRELGRRLEYKQPVVLSHMATGRTPIPIDRALDIARVAGLSPRAFLMSVLEQRHPAIDWSMITVADAFAAKLERVSRKPLYDLSPATKRVLLEAIQDDTPERRWLTAAETPIMDFIRRLYPKISSKGLNAEELGKLRECLGDHSSEAL